MTPCASALLLLCFFLLICHSSVHKTCSFQHLKRLRRWSKATWKKCNSEHQRQLHSLTCIYYCCHRALEGSQSLWVHETKSMSSYVSDIDYIFYSRTIVVRNSRQSGLSSGGIGAVYTFVLLSVCGFSVWDRKFPVIEGGRWWAWSALLCLWFLVAFASEEGSRYAFVSTLTIFPPSCPPTLLLSFLPSFYVFCCVWFPKQSKNVWNYFNFKGIKLLLVISSFLSLSNDLISWAACTFLICRQVSSGFMYTAEIYYL